MFDARVLGVGVGRDSVLVCPVVGHLVRKTLGYQLSYPVRVLPIDIAELLVEVTEDVREPVRLRLGFVSAADFWDGVEVGIFIGKRNIP